MQTLSGSEVALRHQGETPGEVNQHPVQSGSVIRCWMWAGNCMGCMCTGRGGGWCCCWGGGWGWGGGQRCLASSFIAFFYPLSLLLSDSNLCCGKKAKRDSAGKARVAQTDCVKSGRRVQPRPCPAQVCAFKQSVLEPSVAAGDQSVDLPGLSLPPSPSSSLFQPRKVQLLGPQGCRQCVLGTCC